RVPPLRAEQLQVVARDLRGDADLRGVQAGLGRLRLGVRGFGLAPYPPVQVDLPEGVEAEVEGLGQHALVPARAEADELLLAAIVRAVRAHGRQPVQPGVAVDRTRLGEPGGRDAHVEAVAERTLDQVVEHGVAELAPPGCFDLRAGEVLRVRVHETGGRGVRSFVLRTHGAGA